MKKFLLIILLLLTGCTYEFQIQDNITEAKYNDVEIIKEDYDQIKKLINQSKFDSKKNDEKLYNTLIIKTKSNLYKFNISNNFIEYNGHYAPNKNLINYLEKIEKKYYNSNFYKIEYKNDYLLNQTSSNILLDNVNEYIIIEPKEELNDFKINLEEFNGNDYDDIDLLYSKNKINSKVVIRKDLEMDIIRISFKNLYNYKVSIIVKKEAGQIKFETKYE